MHSASMGRLPASVGMPASLPKILQGGPSMVCSLNLSLLWRRCTLKVCITMSLAERPTAQPLSLKPIAEGCQIEGGMEDGKCYQLFQSWGRGITPVGYDVAHREGGGDVQHAHYRRLDLHRWHPDHPCGLIQHSQRRGFGPALQGGGRYLMCNAARRVTVYDLEVVPVDFGPLELCLVFEALAMPCFPSDVMNACLLFFLAVKT